MRVPFESGCFVLSTDDLVRHQLCQGALEVNVKLLFLLLPSLLLSKLCFCTAAWWVLSPCQRAEPSRPQSCSEPRSSLLSPAQWQHTRRAPAAAKP